MGRQKKIVGSPNGSVVRFKDQNGKMKMNITKVVEKKVTHPITGAKVTRRANITFAVPDYTVSTSEVDGKKVKKAEGLTIPSAVEIFGSTDKLIQYAIAGLWAHIRTNESNDLGKADKASRMLTKAAKALKAVMPTLSEEGLRGLLMQSPEFASTFENQEFALEVNRTIDISKLNAPVLDETADEDEADETAEDDEETK